MNIQDLGKGMMDSRKWLKNSGWFSIFVGIFILVIQPFSMTGAIIDVATIFSGIWFFIGLVFLIVGITIVSYVSSSNVFAVKGLENMVGEIEKVQGDKSKVSLVLDASLAITHGNKNLQGFKDFLESYQLGGAEIIVPDEILEEIKDSRIRDVVSKYSEAPETGYKLQRRKAKRFLKSSEKHQNTLRVLPYLKNPQLIHKVPHREKAEIMNGIRLLARNLEEKGYRVSNIGPEKVYDLLIQNGLVSKGDIDVVSSGIYETKTKRDVFILGRDAHIKDAVNSIKQQEHLDKLHYLEFKD